MTNVAPYVSQIGVSGSNITVGIAVIYADPGRLDTHTGTATWGDGTTSPLTVAEKNGAGVALGAHQYARKGTYTIKVLVRDDDGGSTEKTTVVTLH